METNIRMKRITLNYTKNWKNRNRHWKKKTCQWKQSKAIHSTAFAVTILRHKGVHYNLLQACLVDKKYLVPLEKNKTPFLSGTLCQYEEKEMLMFWCAQKGTTLQERETNEIHVCTAYQLSTNLSTVNKQKTCTHCLSTINKQTTCIHWLSTVNKQNTSIHCLSTVNKLLSTVRDRHELLRNVLDYITNYMIKIVFWLHY